MDRLVLCESAEFLKPASSISPRILTSSAWWPDHPFRTACKGWSAAMLGSRSHTEKKAASKGEQKGNDAQRRVPINQSINLPITSSSVEHVITVLIAPRRVIPPHTHTHITTTTTHTYAIILPCPAASPTTRANKVFNHQICRESNPDEPRRHFIICLLVQIKSCRCPLLPPNPSPPIYRIHSHFPSPTLVIPPSYPQT